MLFNGFDKPLHLKRKPSTQLAIYLLVLHGLVLLVLIQALAIPLYLHGLGWMLWLASLVYHAYRYWPRSYDTQQYWVWQGNGDWVCNTAPHHTVMQCKNAIVTAWFVLVTLAAERDTRHCLIFADQLDADTWRRLRVRLAGLQANET